MSHTSHPLTRRRSEKKSDEDGGDACEQQNVGRKTFIASERGAGRPG